MSCQSRNLSLHKTNTYQFNGNSTAIASVYLYIVLYSKHSKRSTVGNSLTQTCLVPPFRWAFNEKRFEETGIGGKESNSVNHVYNLRGVFAFLTGF